MPYRPPRTVCRQCPGYRDTSSFTPVAAASRALSDALDNTASACIYLCSLVACRSIHRTVFYLQASCCCFDHVTCCVLTSLITVLGRDAKTMPVAPPFSCKADQIHILCSCCLQPIPDRRRMTSSPEVELPEIECNIITSPLHRKLNIVSKYFDLLCSLCLYHWFALTTALLFFSGALCHRAFCHLYWGCRKAECLGCLAKFRGMIFS